MPNGGCVTIESANCQITDGDAGKEPDLLPGDYIAITMTDTGEGMSPDVLAKAFDPFFTTKEVGKGSGLGLPQVYGFAKQSAGHVTLASTPGQGTSVRLLLPRLVAGPDEAAAPREQAATP